MRSPLRLLAAVLSASALLAAPAAAAPRPGAAGLGDRLNPGIGNGGYDVLRYDLDLRYATSDPAQGIDGRERILARATQSLSRFNLDFGGAEASGARVNGRRARMDRDGEELVITPRRAIRKGQRFVVTMQFASDPTPPDPDDAPSTAFFVTPDGSGTAPQPYFAHLIYPSNDHPRDKAGFSFRFDVPEGTEAAANGVLRSRRTRGGRTIWRWVQRQPMATELTQLAVGNWDFTSPGRHRGVLITDVTPPSLTEVMAGPLSLEPAQLDWMIDRVGRYPFDAYGTFVPNTDLGFALETQSLTVMDYSWFTFYGQGGWDPTMLHEVSHMWFGDSVTPYEWSDLWVNEGHASWYEFVYAEEKGFLEEDTTGYPDDQGYATLEELMKAVYARGDQWRHDSGPVALPSSGDLDTLFAYNRYHGGALVLYALRQKVGATAFDRIERTWVRRYRDDVASTDDFIRLAAKVSGRRSVKPFLRDWLYGTETPPMPGHPDWTVNPVVVEPQPETFSLSRDQRRR